MIPWRHLTLANIRLPQFTVRKARLYLGTEEIVIPNWTFDEEETSKEETLKRWRSMWTILNWKYRPINHYSAYWRLLHNRPLQAWEPNHTTLLTRPRNPQRSKSMNTGTSTSSDTDAAAQTKQDLCSTNPHPVQNNVQPLPSTSKLPTEQTLAFDDDSDDSDFQPTDTSSVTSSTSSSPGSTSSTPDNDTEQSWKNSSWQETHV